MCLFVQMCMVLTNTTRPLLKTSWWTLRKWWAAVLSTLAHSLQHLHFFDCLQFTTTNQKWEVYCKRLKTKGGEGLGKRLVLSVSVLATYFWLRPALVTSPAFNWFVLTSSHIHDHSDLTYFCSEWFPGLKFITSSKWLFPVRKYCKQSRWEWPGRETYDAVTWDLFL